MRIKSKLAKSVLYPSAGATFINFFAFWFTAMYLGGDAVHGYIKDSHYFLCAHGGCVEVSETVWRYSYWHVHSIWASFILVFIELVIFVERGDVVLGSSNNK
jgi:hypothetical protein